MRIATIPRSEGARTKARGAGKQSEAPLHSIDGTLVLTPFGRIQCTAHRRIADIRHLYLSVSLI